MSIHKNLIERAILDRKDILFSFTKPKRKSKTFSSSPKNSMKSQFPMMGFMNSFHSNPYENSYEDLIYNELKNEQKEEQIEKQKQEMDREIYRYIDSLVSLYLDFHYPYIWKNHIVLKSLVVQYVSRYLFKKLIVDGYSFRKGIQSELEFQIFLFRKLVIFVYFLVDRKINKLIIS